MKRKCHWSVLISVITAVLIGLLAFGDALHHGYSSTRPENVEKAMSAEPQRFSGNVLKYGFFAEQEHLRAMEVYTLEPLALAEDLVLSIQNAGGETIFSRKVSSEEIESDKWSRIFIGQRLNQHDYYELFLTASEEVEQPLLLTMGFERSTITKVGRILLAAVFSLVAITVVIYLLHGRIPYDSIWGKTILSVAMVILLTWTYCSNPFDPGNNLFGTFQDDSNSLVFSRVLAVKDESYPGRYGLGYYSTVEGHSNSEFCDMYREIINEPDGSVINGYSTVFPGIVTTVNPYTEWAFDTGNYLVFPNGREYLIVESWKENNRRYVCVDSEILLSEKTEGIIGRVSVLYPDRTPAPEGMLEPYDSQYGLQGKIMSRIGLLMDRKDITTLLPFLCSLIFSITVIATMHLLCKKYNALFAAVFFTVFWLSPWVVNFGRSVYWVEFTWLLPTMVGLVVSIKDGDFWWTRCGYLLMFITVFVKSLCGYEYITFVMICGVLPMLIDFVENLGKDKKESIRRFRSLAVMGIFSLAGFALALLIHASIRGWGDISEGLSSIYHEDVLRRTLGGDPNLLPPHYRASIEISVLDTIKTYLVFYTQIILGIDGNLFPLFAFMPVILFVLKLVKGIKQNRRAVIAYVFSLLPPLSWFVLAKQHCYFHTHMNYVAWYYPFVPVCAYLIISQTWDIINSRKGNERAE